MQRGPPPVILSGAEALRSAVEGPLTPGGGGGGWWVIAAAGSKSLQKCDQSAS
jgi:hypothetical protein